MERQGTVGDDVRRFWNSRATLGAHAGTRDLIAKQLEIDAIGTHVRDGMRVLDVGCGNGLTALELASRYRITVTGIDYAEEMIETARQLAAERALGERVTFEVADLRTLSGRDAGFDLVYGERVLINLPDWATQHRAIVTVSRLLVPGGHYVMCENSQDGLDRLNGLRARVGLPAITPPWHNRYLRDAEITAAVVPGLRLERVIDYSSTYYFLSRVVNAWLAGREGREPEYDAPVNQLAFELPPIGDVGQGRIWLWARVDGADEGAERG
jgi:ubiquinone/menaquinone biosynthesis C-methylase UbiE